MKGNKDTGKLIKAITKGVHKTDGILDQLKKERSLGMETGRKKEVVDLTMDGMLENSPNKVSSKKSQDKGKTLKDEFNPEIVEKTDPANKRKKMTKSEERIWNEFNKTVESEFYRDKKDVFQMSLSGECLSGYERLALGLGYKLGKKINRNEILRKVLEDFVHKNGAKLEKLIEKL
jgi:hypothetical protein